MRVGIHRDIIICIGCSVGVGMKYLLIALLLMGCSVMEKMDMPREKCIDGVVYYRGVYVLTPKIIRDGAGTSGFSYEKCR